jgi:hypothetical protein
VSSSRATLIASRSALLHAKENIETTHDAGWNN